MVCAEAMTRSSSSVERPALRLLLLALMGLALASRLALGATLPAAGSGDIANAADPLAKLQAAMILCHTGHDHAPTPPIPRGPLLSDLLLWGQADNAHALAGGAIAVPLPAASWSAVAFIAVHATAQPRLWRATNPARGPPAF